MRSRIRKAKHKDLQKVEVHIGCKRKEVAERNQRYIIKLPGKLTVINAKHHHPTQKKFKPRISKKDGVVGTTSFIDELHLKIGAKVMLIHNIDVADMLVNGQIGTLVEIIKTESKKADILVIKLLNSKAGEKNKEKHPNLAKIHPDCIFIERINFQYTLRSNSSEVGMTATLFQFPIRLSHAITAHKIQGQTFVYPLKVSMDINSVFEAGQAYVMLSRVQCIEQLFIVDNLKEEKIRASPAALTELQRLRKISINRNPTPWHKRDSNSVKIASVNCCGLLAHLRDIRNDWKLLNGDILHLLETSLPADIDTGGITIYGYRGNFIKVGNGKGTGTFIKESLEHKEEQEVVKPTLQISKINMVGIDSISVYRSTNHSIPDTSQSLESLIEIGRPTLITGDFNICSKKNSSNGISTSLVKMGFKKILERPTHIQGGHIDHVYWIDRTKRFNQPQVEVYSPYWTDHDAILTTITKR